jgi:molybdate/tungstate transport system substrate-binding protein
MRTRSGSSASLRRARDVPILALTLGTLCALLPVASVSPARAAARPEPGTSTVQVDYAATIGNTLGTRFAAAFQRRTGFTFSGDAASSFVLVQQIKQHLSRPDVFISAAPFAEKQLEGPANGNIVSWDVSFARAEVVVAFNRHSRFATDLRAAQAGLTPWFQVLTEPGFRLGRGAPLANPATGLPDPEGVEAIWTAELAGTFYHLPNLRQQLLGADDNPAQTVSTDQLVQDLTSGRFDAALMHINRAREAHLPFITLPDHINLGDPALASTYTTATYTDPVTGQTAPATPDVYTVTIPSTVQNPAGALAFVLFLLSHKGQDILIHGGLLRTPFVISGDQGSVPPAVLRAIQRNHQGHQE